MCNIAELSSLNCGNISICVLYTQNQEPLHLQTHRLGIYATVLVQKTVVNVIK